jgi:hypothetical protein
MNHSISHIAWFTRNDVEQNSCDYKLPLSTFLTKALVPLFNSAGIKVSVFSDNVTDIVCDDGKSYKVGHYLNAYQNKLVGEKFDIYFHQVEEGKKSHFLRSAIGIYPGITYFHDLYLTDLGPDPLTNSPWSWVANKVFSEKIGSNLLIENIDWPNYSDEFPRNGPFPQREVSLSIGTLSSSRRFCDDITRSEFAKNKLNYFCPYPVTPYPSTSCPESLTTESKNDSLFKIALLGTPNIEDRIHKIFAAIRSLKTKTKVFWLVDKANLSTAKARAEEFGITVEFFHSVNPNCWFNLLSNCNAGIQLRFTSFGGLSPFIEYGLVTQKPLLVSDFGDSDYYNDNYLYKIPMGSFESNSVKYILENIIAGNKNINLIGAKDFVTNNNDKNYIFQNLLAAFENINNQSKSEINNFNSLKQAALKIFDKKLYQLEYKELGWS